MEMFMRTQNTYARVYINMYERVRNYFVRVFMHHRLFAVDAWLITPELITQRNISITARNG